jgi:hypothetical protein
MKRAIGLVLAAAPFAAWAQVVPEEPQIGRRTGAESQPADRTGRIEGAFHDRLNGETSQLFEDGEFPRAIGILTVQTRHRPTDYERATDLIWMLGNIQDRPRELGEAAWFRMTNPDNPDAWYPEAQVHFMDRAYPNVVPLLVRAALVSRRTGRPLQPNGWRLLAHSYDRVGLLQQSLTTWDEYIKLVPDDLAAQRNRERVAQKLAEAGG